MKTDLTSSLTFIILTSALCLPCFPSNGAELPSLGSDPTTLMRQVPGNTLEDFFIAALDYSPRLRIAEENLNIGSSRRRASSGQLLPQLSANVSISDNRRDDQSQLLTFDGERYSVQLSQVLFDWQAYSARKGALLIEDQLEAEYYYELAWILADVADRYLNVLQAQDALDSIASELEAVLNQLDQIQSQFDLQLAQITDLYQTQASLAAVQAEQLQLQSELAIAEETLRSATGIDIGRLYKLDPAMEVPQLEDGIEYWVDQAQVNNHRIQAEKYAAEAAKERISETKGAFMPQVAFIAQQQESNVGFDNAPLSSDTDITFVGINVTIPIYAGGSNRARVSEARSQHRIAESELRQVQLETNELVRSAFLQVQSSASRTEAARVLAESTAISATAMQQGFELGVVTSVDVLNALRDQFRAERDLQQARYDHIRYLLALWREAGILEADDLVEISSWLIPPQ